VRVIGGPRIEHRAGDVAQVARVHGGPRKVEADGRQKELDPDARDAARQ